MSDIVGELAKVLHQNECGCEDLGDDRDPYYVSQAQAVLDSDLVVSKERYELALEAEAGLLALSLKREVERDEARAAYREASDDEEYYATRAKEFIDRAEKAEAALERVTKLADDWAAGRAPTAAAELRRTTRTRMTDHADILRRAAKKLDERLADGLSFDPDLDNALAAWLRSVLETHEGDPSDYCGGKGHEDFLDGVLQPCASWWCDNVDHALAVARALLREADQ